MEPVRASVFLPGELFLQVKKEARKRDMTHSEFLRETIAAGMGFRLAVKDDIKSGTPDRATKRKAKAV